MDLNVVIHIVSGGTFGLLLRLYIKYNFRPRKLFYFNNSLIVNILSSLFMGILVALSPSNQNLLLFFSVGFLGCFSTFSSFIYQLFNLIKKRKFLSLLVYYLQVIVLTYLFFCLGFFITLIFKN